MLSAAVTDPTAPVRGPDGHLLLRALPATPAGQGTGRKGLPMLPGPSPGGWLSAPMDILFPSRVEGSKKCEL